MPQTLYSSGFVAFSFAHKYTKGTRSKSKNDVVYILNLEYSIAIEFWMGNLVVKQIAITIQKREVTEWMEF